MDPIQITSHQLDTRQPSRAQSRLYLIYGGLLQLEPMAIRHWEQFRSIFAQQRETVWKGLRQDLSGQIISFFKFFNNRAGAGSDQPESGSDGGGKRSECCGRVRPRDPPHLGRSISTDRLTTLTSVSDQVHHLIDKEDVVTFEFVDPPAQDLEWRFFRHA